MEKVQDTHIRGRLPELHRAVLEIVGVMNQPERDTALLDLAGLALERALFPLLVLVERLGPIGVVELAGRVGRDYTTVSRQVARLDELGLIQRRAGAKDRRVREAIVTDSGRVATQALDRARETMALTLFQDWSREDFDALVGLMGRMAQGLCALPLDFSAETVGSEDP